MFCPACGRQLSDDARFCPGCGSPVAPASPETTPGPPAAGGPVRPEAAPTPQAPQPAQPMPQPTPQPPTFEVTNGTAQGMKWFKFVIYAQLFLSAAASLLNAFALFTAQAMGTPQTWSTPSTPACGRSTSSLRSYTWRLPARRSTSA